ncbi:E3 ubiquitin-protein ligase TRIM39-like [Pristis pectinata]|uniref:E3 ubiquitin-protein ligase TRIM39-like n=1 Tax=Pristis pectinata TaxID=685728 RepID=UPI00223D37A1|nr:E3 ubiquitin-protein ligase TRIM39-like [Pristis pectinata]
MSKKLLTSLTNCSKHNEEFKLYCQEDDVPVCVICIVAGRHKAHSVVTLNEMLKHAKSMLESQAGDLQTHMSLIQNNIKYIANNIVEVNASTSRLQKQLSQKYRDMITTLKRVEDETMAIVKAEQMKIINSLNESISKRARNITLDVETSHPTLEITDDGKAVSVRENPLDIPLSPKRFTQVTAVLASEGFNTGKHYWEVTVQDKSNWSVGIVKESMPRGENSNLMNSPLAWSVAFQQTLYLAWHNNISTPLEVTRLQRLGVFLDYEAGQLAFYNANTMTPLHTFSESFTETVYPAFNPGRSNDKMRKAILILRDVGSV